MLIRINKNLSIITRKSFSLFKIKNSQYSNLAKANVDTSKLLPKSTKVVICGGGLIGTSIAYHLVQLGFKDIVLLTKHK